MIDAAISERESPSAATGSVELGSIIPLAIGGFVPYELPGVALGAAGIVIGVGFSGLPSPGMRSVVQPKAAKRQAIESAAAPLAIRLSFWSLRMAFLLFPRVI
jgi:hypothetical protein